MDPTLSQTEVILLAPGRQALALSYLPGETPAVIANLDGQKALDLLWSAQEMGVPVVECAELNRENMQDLQIGQEIPDRLFRPAAQAIALVQRSRPGPMPVRLVKDLQRRPKQRASQLPSSSCLSIELRQQDWIAPVEALTTLHRQRFQKEIGLPVLSLDILYVPDLECDGRILMQGASLYQWTGPNFGDLMAGLHQVVRNNAHRLLGFRETEALVESLRKSHKELYQALFPEFLTVSGLRQILRNLLREGIRIRDITSVLEAIEEHKNRSADPDQLTEFVRASLNFQLCREYADAQGVVQAMLLAPELEKAVMKDVRQASSAIWFDLDVDVSLRLLSSVARAWEKAQDQGFKPVLLCGPRARRFIKRLVEPSFPHLPVISYPEVAPDADVHVFTSLGGL
ncbi:MAG: FHIPEP family type III secretion protein [Candidatus Eremiobacteraeota bacterium]|nr:FHIPEP family type III secretion protein [Candidatus Eremiobacteraeota bacterium]MCW5870565.1 FHIPEP family type III secretion protein [Candidatus Eremiobacteraeota bacterium]